MINKLPDLCNKLSLLSVYDLDAVTYHELVYALYDKVNEMIESYKDMGIEVSKELQALKDKLDEVYKQVPTEVDKILNGWKDAGEFDELINKAFNELKPIVDKAVEDVNKGVEKLNAHLENVNINVKEYGATGDGITDDTASIKKALEKLKLKRGTLYFPEGEYKCGSITLPSYTKVTGASRNTKIIANDHTLFKLAGDFISIENITLDGGGAGNTCEKLIDGLKDTLSNNFTLQGCHLEHCKGEYVHMVDLKMISEIRIINNEFSRITNNSGTAYYINLHNGCFGFRIEGNTFNGMPQPRGNGSTSMLKVDSEMDEGVGRLVVRQSMPGEIVNNNFIGSANLHLEISAQNINLKNNSHQVSSPTPGITHRGIVLFNKCRHLSMLSTSFIIPANIVITSPVGVSNSERVNISGLTVEYYGENSLTYPQGDQFFNMWTTDKISLADVHIIGNKDLDSFIQLQAPGEIDLHNIQWKNRNGGLYNGIKIREKTGTPSITISNFILQCGKMSYPVNTTMKSGDTSINGYIYIYDSIFRGTGKYWGVEYPGLIFDSFTILEIKNSLLDRDYVLTSNKCNNTFLEGNQLSQVVIKPNSSGNKVEIFNNIFKCPFNSTYAINYQIDNAGSYNLRTKENYIMETKTLVYFSSSTGVVISNQWRGRFINDKFEKETSHTNTEFMTKSSNITGSFWENIYLDTNVSLYGFNYGIHIDSRHPVKLANGTLYWWSEGSTVRMFSFGLAPDNYTQVKKEV